MLDIVAFFVVSNKCDDIITKIFGVMIMNMTMMMKMMMMKMMIMIMRPFLLVCLSGESAVKTCISQTTVKVSS